MPAHDPLLFGMIGLLWINTLSGLAVQAILLRRASIQFPFGWRKQIDLLRRIWAEPLGESAAIRRLQTGVKSSQVLQVVLLVSSVVRMFLLSPAARIAD